MVSILGIYSLRNLNFQQTTIKSRKNQEAIVTDIWKEVIFFTIAPHYIFGTPCDHKGYELWLIDCNAVTQNCWWPKSHPLIFYINEFTRITEMSNLTPGHRKSVNPRENHIPALCIHFKWIAYGEIVIEPKPNAGWTNAQAKVKRNVPAAQQRGNENR